MYIPFGAVLLNGPLTGIPSKAPEKISERNRDAINSDTISALKKALPDNLGGAFFVHVSGGYLEDLGMVYEYQCIDISAGI